MSYTIGQVIYVLSNKTQTVLPGIIRQEIVNRSLDGESVSYKIAIGPPEKQRIVDLSSVDGEVYGSIDEVRNVLISRLTAFVDDLCANTMGRVNSWYGNVDKSSTATNQTGEKLDPSVFLSEVGNSPRTQTPNNAMNNLRSALSDPDLSTREVMMPDGSVRKIAVNLPQE